MSDIKKYVFIKKFNSNIFDKLIIGNIYEIEFNNKIYYYPYYIPKYDIYLGVTDLWYKFVPLEQWREQQIHKILNT